MLEDFTSWVVEPSSYNWITLVAAVAAFMTAVFTGYTALLTWLDRRHRIFVEWHHSIEGAGIKIGCKITNDTPVTLEGERLQVKGPVINVDRTRATPSEKKHSSWRFNECPLRHDEIENGQVVRMSFIIVADHHELTRLASKLSVRVSSSIGFMAWRLFKWRLSVGPKFSMTLILRRRSSLMRPIRLTHSIRIHPEQAKRIAEIIENNAAQK